MKLQKYVFLLPQAIDRITKRYGMPYLSPSYIFVLYTIQYLPSSCTQQAIIRHAKRLSHTISPATISLAVNLFIQHELVDIVDGRFSLSPRGREFLSAIRRYLLNKRL